MVDFSCGGWSTALLVDGLCMSNAEREITVYFTADAADGMPWKFRPTQRMVKVRIDHQLVL